MKDADLILKKITSKAKSTTAANRRPAQTHARDTPMKLPEQATKNTPAAIAPARQRAKAARTQRC